MIDTEGSGDLPCVSETGTDAGSLSGQQGINFDNFDRAELAEMQKNDVDIGIVYGWLIDSSRRPDRGLVHDKSPTVRNLWLSWNQLELVDGLLFKRHDTNNKLTTRKQLVVPEKLRDRVMEASHTSVMSGHLGIKKTLSKVQRSFYWFNMKETVRLFLANCLTCGARKRPTTKPRAPLGEYVSGSPMDRIAIDIMGPFPLSNKGNRYVLVIGDHFTKWIEAYGIPDQRANTVADVIVKEFIVRFGTPLEIHSDQGKTFESTLFHDICKLLEVTKTRTTPYHPASNGMIERFNRTLVDMIASYVDRNQLNWDENLALLTSAYRGTVHETTGFSPNFLMLGREVRTPIEFALGIDRPMGDQEVSRYHEYAADLADSMIEAGRIARDNLCGAAARQKRNYDVRLSVNNFEAGDLVYYLDTTKQKGLSPKLKQAKWIGPCIIVRKVSDLIFEVRSQQRGKSKVLHHDRLKPYVSSHIPAWIEELSSKIKELKLKENQRQAATQTNPRDIVNPRRSDRVRNRPNWLGR